MISVMRKVEIGYYVFYTNHKLHTSVGKLPVHDEILNKNACGNFASIFSVIKNAIFFPPWCNMCGVPTKESKFTPHQLLLV